LLQDFLIESECHEMMPNAVVQLRAILL
jgi:hypothetical protein